MSLVKFLFYFCVVCNIGQVVSQSRNPRISFKEYPKLKTIENYLNKISRQFSRYLTVEKVGRSHEKRDIYLVSIGNDKGKNSIWIDAGMHAREWISPITSIYLIERLIEEFRYRKDRSPYTKVNWLIMPMTNPDGYHYTHTEDRFWRKNRAPPPAGSNCTGVDLNRNFGLPPPHEKGFSVGSSPNPCLHFYGGEYPNSEPETQAIVSTFNDHMPNITSALALHSFGQKWLTAWAYKHDRPAYRHRLDAWARRAVKAIEEVHDERYSYNSAAYGQYLFGGSTQDFYHASGVMFAATVELRDKGSYEFKLPEEEIIPVGEEMWAAMEEVAITATNPDDF